MLLTLCVIFIAIAQSSSGGIAIRYVLPVLWMPPGAKYAIQIDSPGAAPDLVDRVCFGSMLLFL